MPRDRAGVFSRGYRFPIAIPHAFRYENSRVDTGRLPPRRVATAYCGTGDSVGGIAFPFFADKATGCEVRLVAVEPQSCPTLTRGISAYDFGDAVGLTPLMKLFTLGHDFVPPGIHAGGLRYHGDSPLVCQLFKEGLLEAVAVPQGATFEAGVRFAQTEGIISAPESNHAVRAVTDEALRCRESREPKILQFNLSGYGHFDMSSYDKFYKGELEYAEFPEEALKVALSHLPKVEAA